MYKMTAALELRETDDYVFLHDFRASSAFMGTRTSDCLCKESYDHSHKFDYLIINLEIEQNLKYFIYHS